MIEINEEDKMAGQALNTISRGVHDKVLFLVFYVVLLTYIFRMFIGVILRNSFCKIEKCSWLLLLCKTL